MALQPFTIHVAQPILADLQTRLAQTRWPRTINAGDWDYGTDCAYLQELVAYWRASFDWPKQERALNALPHFRTTIDGVSIHFMYVRGMGVNPLPLILTHGWPSSFFEMYKIIPLLTDPVQYGGDPADSFDVVVPSLPGYGFSDHPMTPGFSRRIPELWMRLMTEVLGYRRFAAHGSDIGGMVTNRLGYEYPDRLIGIHVTFVAEPYLGPGAMPLSERESALVRGREAGRETGGAYAHIQRTRPHTLSYGLNDSPAGLAAWIIEKWHSWSDCAGTIETRFTKDELLTNVMIYWVTETIGSSFRIYADWALGTASMPFVWQQRSEVPAGVDSKSFGWGERIEVPVGVALFRERWPREWAERVYQRLERWTEMPRGGHFPALEEPILLSEDLRAFFRPLRTEPGGA